MESDERLLRLCEAECARRGLGADYVNRLREEAREIEGQGEADYFLGLHERRVRYPANERNLLVPSLLGLVPEFDLAERPDEVMTGYPDIDVDYLDRVRDYLKNDWTPATFGSDKVCAIGNYSTFGIKSTLIDMARVHGLDRTEILALTTKLGLKDEDGAKLTFDRALEEYPDLRAYCNLHPEVERGVRKLVGRNRGMSVHAGGVIISSKRIDDILPLVTDKNGVPVSAWPEGQHSQDLGPMGFVKYDQLVISNLLQVAICLKLVKDRHHLDHVCSDPEVNRDWSDTSYLEDPKALGLANDGDLLGIFQFDSFGIRRLCKGNVKRFDDMVAFNALYRPGPLAMMMHDRYVDRMHGREDWETEMHPILREIMKGTHGVLVYQEQAMQILHAVGRIPMRDCYAMVSAISKKNVDKFAGCKEQFLSAGVEVLHCPMEKVVEVWNQLEAMAGYAFNKSHATAYAYQAMRCLFLKAHFPIEFYAATLGCEDKLEKIREYIVDARVHSIPVRGADINRSRADVSIGECDDGSEAIFYGFAKIKEVGEAVSARIEQGQPYRSFEDFLLRFGTHSAVLKSLISLGIFGADRVDKYKFYEHYLDWSCKATTRDKANVKSLERHHQKLFEAVPSSFREDVGFTPEHFARYSAAVGPEQMHELEKMRRAYFRCIETHAQKKENDSPPRFADFLPDQYDIDETREALLSGTTTDAELAYYGFAWTHPLEGSEDYRPERDLSFSAHRASVAEGGRSRYVEASLDRVEKRPTRNGGVYYRLLLTDAHGEQAMANAWENDFAQFEGDLAEGNLIKIMLDPPDKGFPTYKVMSLPWTMRNNPPSRDLDLRVVVYAKGGGIG